MRKNDLIRRGDALKIALGLATAESAEKAHHAIAALPAVTVGVKPLVWQRMPAGSAWDWQAWCDLMRGYYYAGTDAQKREHEAVRAARILAALEPVDAAQPSPQEVVDALKDAAAVAMKAREAALREAAAVAKYYAEQDYCWMGYPEDGGIAASGTAHTIERDILALIPKGAADDRA